MNRNWTVRVNPFALLAIALLLAPAVAMAQSQFQTLDYPDAIATIAYDINDLGQIVGTYYVAGGISHGFLYDPVRCPGPDCYTAIDYPGADWSEAKGINRQGEIVGFYGYNYENFFHGFKRTANGTFISIDRGGRWNTMPQDINGSGAVVGCVHNIVAWAMFGWVLQDGAFTSETVGQGWTGYDMYTGINDAGTLVGWSWQMNMSGARSFVLVGTGRTDIEYPGASNTQAWDVNSVGDIVGWYGTPGAGRGFLLRNGQFTEIYVPDSRATGAYGINAGGDIVGVYRDGTTGTRHGFLLPGK